MYGFQPASARKAPHQPAGARQRTAEGGVIRGPGTGTSDSIEDTVPAGTYIMPADSTAQIGDQALAGMGARGFTPKSQRKGVDVRLSNGEYELPPEQVHAVGVQALDALKNATHEQVGEGLGFGPGSASDAMFFADGGLVSREGNSYSGGNVSGRVSINGGAPGGTMSSIGAPVAPSAPAAVPGVPETSVRMLPAASPPGGFGPTSATGAFGRATPAAVDPRSGAGLGFRPRGYANGGVVDEEERRRSNSFGDAAAAARDSSVTQLGAPRPAAASTGSRDLGASIPAPLPMLTPSLPPSPQAQQLAGFGAPSAAGAGRGAINPPPARPAADAVAAANDASLRFSGYPLTDEQQSRVVARFDQDARDRAAGAEAARQGVAPVFGISAPAPAPVAPATTTPTPTLAVPAAVAPSAPAAAAAAPAADAASGTGFGFVSSAERVAQMNRDIAHEKDKQTWRAPSDQAPGLAVIDGAGFGQAARQRFFDDADLRTAAARGSWSPRRGFQSDQGAVAAAAIPVQNRQQAELEAGRQAADTQRAGLGFQSAAQREAAAARLQAERIAAEDRRAADTNSIRREEVGSANRLRDTQVAAAEDEAALRRIVLDPKTSVSERARAQQGLLAMQGKVAGGEWKPVALQGSTDASGNKTEGVLAAVNSATGEVRRLDQGQGASAPQPLPPKDKLVRGQVYQTARGAARWDGSMFQPV
ncbi:hypothetical protein [Variovorax sp.]|jgi:hypothetical protein|uniref:hypothetical protein n=1 Tax=Variovorax sp. TaxID=1871043 RepID=UPI0037DA6403